MMLTVDQARTRILDAVSRMPAKKCGIVDSLGCILAQSVYAGENIPPFDNSAMDGYALIASDVETSSDENPVTLDVIETIPAGYAPVKQVKNGQATQRCQFITSRNNRHFRALIDINLRNVK